jgi:hypothetical protein
MTQTLPAADPVEALDYEVACTIGRGPHADTDPCLTPAEWLGVRTCCPGVAFWCQPHYAFVTTPISNPWICSECGATSPGRHPLARFSRVERIR